MVGQAIKIATHDTYIKGLEDDKFNDAIRASSLPEPKNITWGTRALFTISPIIYFLY